MIDTLTSYTRDTMRLLKTYMLLVIATGLIAIVTGYVALVVEQVGPTWIMSIVLVALPLCFAVSNRELRKAILQHMVKR